MDLFEAFGLAPGAIVAAVGGGGKTSLVFALASDAASRGLSAVVTSTVRFTQPGGIGRHRVVEGDERAIVRLIEAQLAPATVLLATAGEGGRGRFLGFPATIVDEIGALHPGILAVEADGSAHRPFKAPAEHEPVIPSSATDVVLCLGLSVLGHPLDETWVHRPELVCRLSGASLGDPITADIVTGVLLHESGGRKGVPPSARLHALLNGPLSEEHETLGTHIAQRLVYGGYDRAVVATAHRQGDVRAVVS